MSHVCEQVWIFWYYISPSKWSCIHNVKGQKHRYHKSQVFQLGSSLSVGCFSVLLRCSGRYWMLASASHVFFCCCCCCFFLLFTVSNVFHSNQSNRLRWRSGDWWELIGFGNAFHHVSRPYMVECLLPVPPRLLHHGLSQTFSPGEGSLAPLHCGAGHSCFDYAYWFVLSSAAVLDMVLQALMTFT